MTSRQCDAQRAQYVLSQLSNPYYDGPPLDEDDDLLEQEYEEREARIMEEQYEEYLRRQAEAGEPPAT